MNQPMQTHSTTSTEFPRFPSEAKTSVSGNIQSTGLPVIDNSTKNYSFLSDNLLQKWIYFCKESPDNQSIKSIVGGNNMQVSLLPSPEISQTPEPLSTPGPLPTPSTIVSGNFPVHCHFMGNSCNERCHRQTNCT